MKRLLFLYFLLIILFSPMYGQTKAELEDQRKKTLEEISYVDNLLKETEKERKEGINELKIIGNKLNLRESIINGFRQEINLLAERVDLNNIAIDMMESDMVLLKGDYSKAVLSSYKSSKSNSELGYILSASDFNQGYKRLKYLQQVTKFRRRETEIILELKSQIEATREDLEKDLNKLSDLKRREEQQKNLLQGEQNKKQKLVKSLNSKERQLQKDLEEKRRIARKIESEIARMIEEERRKGTKVDQTPEQRLISDNFAENKGRIPWPVERGVITSHFGLQDHPVLKYVKENNIDIEITSSGLTPVRSVFRGEVARVFSINGANMAIIIRHGKYLTVYQNLINVKVKTGDKVETKQEIATVYCDTDNGEKSILKFMVTEDKVTMDPELWISKKK